LIASSVLFPSVPNGLLNGGSWALFQSQSIGVGVAVLLGFGGTMIITKVIDKTIGLRVKQIEEDIGLDISMHAEKAYLE